VAVLMLLAAVCAAAVAGTAASAEPAAADLDGVSLASLLRSGGSLDAEDLTVHGDVLLDGASDVPGSLRCIHCRFDGGLHGRDAHFHGVVDISMSTVTGPVDLRGATFGRSFTWSGGVAMGGVSLALTVFDEAASFDGVAFAAPTTFAGSRFAAGVTFADADFAGTATFDGAIFAAETTFSGSPILQSQAPATVPHCESAVSGDFARKVTFRWAEFRARADFRGRCFGSDADFTNAAFGDRSDFGFAQFAGDARFNGCRYGGDASFKLVRFLGPADLSYVVAASDLDLAGADFRDQVTMTGASISGTLSLAGAFMHRHLLFDEVTTHGLLLDVRHIDWIVGVSNQVTALQRVETTARAAGDSATANYAHFEWLRRSADQRDDVATVLGDQVIYRQVAGYLVRPWYPIRALVVLMVIGFLARTVHDRRSPAPPGQPTTFIKVLPRSAADTIAAAARLRPKVPLSDQPSLGEVTRAGLRAAEYATYKVLLVLVLFSIGNANPTVHQFIQSLTP
jgi:uncharacterized protein YjbI with pentapeptide repeats